MVMGQEKGKSTYSVYARNASIVKWSIWWGVWVCVILLFKYFLDSTKWSSTRGLGDDEVLRKLTTFL